MKKERKDGWRVLVIHNDFPDGTRQNSFYGKSGAIARRVQKNIAPGANLEWHFHGGHIRPERTTLMRRLRQADVLISAYPWNMDMEDDNMHWFEAERSMLTILQNIKKENKKLKIFFLLEPHHLIEEFQKIGEFVSDIHESPIYDYFLKR
jgi:hypothetical protein